MGEFTYLLRMNINLCLPQSMRCINHHLACCLFIAGLGSKYAGLASEPQLSDLMNEVASKVSAKWKEISIQLGLTPSDQESFMASTPNDPIQCFTSVFRVWKNQETRPYTWSTVIKALESPAVDEMRLAQELRTKLHAGSGK